MRFFTWKLWEQGNSNNDAVSTRANDAWISYRGEESPD